MFQYLSSGISLPTMSRDSGTGFDSRRKIIWSWIKGQTSLRLCDSWLASAQQSMNLIDRVCHFHVKLALPERRRGRTRIASDAVVDAFGVWISGFASFPHRIAHGGGDQLLAHPTFAASEIKHFGGGKGWVRKE